MSQAGLNANNRSPHAAVIFPYFAHYREPTLRRLVSQPPPAPRYTLFSDAKAPSRVDALKLIDWETAQQSVSEGGLGIRRLRNISLLGYPILWQLGVLRLAWSRQYDVLVFMDCMWYLSTWPAALLARWRGKRVLKWGHGYVRQERSFKGWLRHQFNRLFHGSLLFGNHGRQLLVARGFPESGLYVMFNSLDQPAQRQIREQLEPEAVREVRETHYPEAPERPMVITVGRLIDRKRIDLLVEATARLRDEHFPINVLVVGDGPARASLHAQAERLHLDHQIRFIGPCYEERQLAHMIAAADLCVVPGWIGLTAMHAMAYGTPVITHGNAEGHAPEFEAVVPGRTGAFFPEGDPNGLAQAIRDWLAKQSPEAREQVRENCYRIIDQYYNPFFQCQVINEAVQGVPARQVIPFAE